MINIAQKTAELINDMSVTVTYREARVCSCVGNNHGSPDPTDDCIRGFRYGDPVEYNLLRTSIDMKRVSQKASVILQGGCRITIPRVQLSHNALLTGVDLSSGLDLSDAVNIKVSMDSGTAKQINCALKAADHSDVSVAEIVYSINSAGLGKIAYESGDNGDPNGAGYITLRSLKVGANSSIEFLPPNDTDATGKLFGLVSDKYPYLLTPSATTGQFLTLYDEIARGDIIVISGRTSHDDDTMKRGSKDRVKAFDIERIISVTSNGVFYRETIDFTFDGSIITWLESKGPGVGEPYIVEFLGKTNYIVYEELPTDRGADDDVVAKKIHLQLRNYDESGAEENLPIDRIGTAFSSGFDTGHQIGSY